VLEDIWAGDEGNYEAVAALIEAYVPTGADGFRLGMALQQRKDLVSQLVEKVPDTYARKGIDGVAALVGQADDTLRMLTQATTQLQVFIREQVSVEDFQRVASRFGEKPYPAL
jgi:hypothetical protein